jgi:hypothetical protein
MWGVQATTDTPSATIALAMLRETEISAAPSSIPGKMWQWRSIMERYQIRRTGLQT